MKWDQYSQFLSSVRRQSRLYSYSAENGSTYRHGRSGLEQRKPETRFRSLSLFHATLPGLSPDPQRPPTLEKYVSMRIAVQELNAVRPSCASPHFLAANVCPSPCLYPLIN